MLTKHSHLIQVCILLIFNIKRGNVCADTYSHVFAHFSTQFVRGCSSSLTAKLRIWHIPMLPLPGLMSSYQLLCGEIILQSDRCL